MGQRCIVLLNNFLSQNFNEDSIIDATNLTTKETLSKIMEVK